MFSKQFWFRSALSVYKVITLLHKLDTLKTADQILTKMVDLDRGHLSDGSLDKEIQVREDDERRCQGRTGVVLNYQVVALELPVDVAVRLHFREGVAEWKQTRGKCSKEVGMTV